MRSPTSGGSAPGTDPGIVHHGRVRHLRHRTRHHLVEQRGDLAPEGTAPQWGDYTLEATFRIARQNATIVFNAQDNDNYLMWQLRGDGVNQLAPHTRIGGRYEVLKTVPLPVSLQRDTDYDLRLEVSGSTVRTFLDDQLIDTTQDVPFSHGTVGFRTGGSETSAWDDLSVTSTGGGVLFQQDFDVPTSDFSCGTVSGGRLVIGTSSSCLYGVTSNDWAFLRGEFDTAPDKEIRWATVFATGASAEPGSQYVYKLYLNGEFVGLGPTRSISTETRFDGYDVTRLVSEGGNASGLSPGRRPTSASRPSWSSNTWTAPAR